MRNKPNKCANCFNICEVIQLKLTIKKVHGKNPTVNSSNYFCNCTIT